MRKESKNREGRKQRTLAADQGNTLVPPALHLLGPVGISTVYKGRKKQ